MEHALHLRVLDPVDGERDRANRGADKIVPRVVERHRGGEKWERLEPIIEEKVNSLVIKPQHECLQEVDVIIC